MKIDLQVESTIKRTARVAQLSGMFDVPPKEKLAHTWAGDVPIEERDWNVGLIVGNSGAGKSSVMRQMFGEPPAMTWKARSVVDDFAAKLTIQQITDACSAVGFNTIPSWMKPHSVLSTGEKFRVELARALLERGDPIVIDEFTSVVDRQVAKIGSHAVQKLIRKQGRKFVAVTCHYDVLDWLQPDWVLEPATMRFTWREVQRRPSLDVEICRVKHETWQLFAPYHYLSRDIHPGAVCFGLFVNGVIASFLGVIHFPHPTVKDVKRGTRTVTLPDYQGMGLTFVLNETIGAAYSALGFSYRGYPAHPGFARAFDRSPKWRMLTAPGNYAHKNVKRGAGGTFIKEGKLGKNGKVQTVGDFGGRPCATFEYAGEKMDRKAARALLDGKAPVGAGSPSTSAVCAGAEETAVRSKPNAQARNHPRSRSHTVRR